MKQHFLLFLRSFSFAWWSLRRRTGQIVPVALSFILLVGAVQSIGALHDISSVLVQQQIARNWRGLYDLLIRPQSAVSGPERSAGWIDPQGVFETYGGISQQQISNIGTIAHVIQVAPFAMAGWQPVNVLLPVELASKGVYRISAVWNGEWKTNGVVVRYVDVTDLAHITNEMQVPGITVQHVVSGGQPVLFTVPVPALQAVIGVPRPQQERLSQALLENIARTPAMPVSLRVERLRGELSSLPGCLARAECWESQQVRQGAVSYQGDGVQLLRYSHTRYVATPQQIAGGQISMMAPGRDLQGPLYRVLLSDHVVMPVAMEDVTSRQFPGQALLPFSVPQRLALITNAVRFVPIEQACAVNGERCYSGLYVRLSGVERYSQQSLALLQATAATIAARTGLHVDILDGSSLRAVSISVLDSSGAIARVQSMWRVVGVAVQIKRGFDALQAMLLALCSIVCLLAVGTAGVLVGVGRRKDALLVRQVGWQRSVLVTVFTFDGLALCGPGCLLAAGWTMVATRIWAGSLSPLVTWVLLGVGVLVYCCSLVVVACSGMRKNARAYRAKITVEIVRGLALSSAAFLIAIGYLLITDFNQELIVTVLGRQVHAALEGSQALVLLVILGAALLSAGFCSKLLLQGRREELQLLAMVGWERRDVVLRIMWGTCFPALVSGEIGVLLASGGIMLAAGFPSLFTVLGLLLCGPLLGMLLAGSATIGVAWQETGRAFRWR